MLLPAFLIMKAKLIGTPIPSDQCEPVSREEQAENMHEFIAEIVNAFARQRKAV
jgi:hypothetical protein